MTTFPREKLHRLTPTEREAVRWRNGLGRPRLSAAATARQMGISPQRVYVLTRRAYQKVGLVPAAPPGPPRSAQILVRQGLTSVRLRPEAALRLLQHTEGVSLTEAQREALALFTTGIPLPQIARQLDISQSAVRQRLTAGAQRLLKDRGRTVCPVCGAHPPVPPPVSAV